MPVDTSVAAGRRPRGRIGGIRQAIARAPAAVFLLALVTTEAPSRASGSPSGPDAAASPPPVARPVDGPRRGHWAFEPRRRPAPPEVGNRGWVRDAIDCFVLARLEAQGVEPAREADRSTLLRRLSLDLLGLPATPEELHEFVTDASPDAYERLVDRLLGSPRFGERWGRHWLDLARYADSDGYEKDSPRPWAWRYRDWVIDAINRDLPFDRFTHEQLAGDLLPDADLGSRVATGFHRNTLTNREGGVDQEEFRVKAVVDRVNTTGTVWLGLTLGCSECHSHKYDPLPQREYYGIFAFFNTAREETIDAPVHGHPEAKAPVLVESPRARRTYIHVRGDFLSRGEEVQAHTPAILHPLRPRGETPDRLDLARWLTDPRNPLTPRVTANRIWQRLFGVGLVRTPEDFGTRGEPPTHPALLDWLASELVENDWSLKTSIRSIVLSATYRQSSHSRPELAGRDPANRLLARQNRFRCSAETVRDLCLAASGLIDGAIGGPSIRPPLPADVAALGYANSVKWVESGGADRYSRGVYIFFQRTVPYPMLTTFDSPDANVTCVRRERSNTPLQALTLLNDPVFVECARALGGRLLREVPDDADRRIGRAFEICVNRKPLERERTALRGLYEDLLGIYEEDAENAMRIAGTLPENGPTRPHVVAATVGIARTVLNLDEFFVRE